MHIHLYDRVKKHIAGHAAREFTITQLKQETRVSHSVMKAVIARLQREDSITTDKRADGRITYQHKQKGDS